MPQQQMSELTDALEQFNNVSLPTQSFFFAVLMILLVFFVFRALFGRDQRRDDLLALSMKSSTQNGEAITGLKQDIADTLKELREDRAREGQRHDETIKKLSANVALYDGNIVSLQSTQKELVDGINKVNDGIANIKSFIPSLATKSEMDLWIGRMETAMGQLGEIKRVCQEKKTQTGEIPLLAEAAAPPSTNGETVDEEKA